MPATNAKSRRPAAPKAPPRCIVCRRPIETSQAREAVTIAGEHAHGHCWERSQAEISARAEAMPPYTTVCDGCREWVPTIMHRTLDGKRLCGKCAPEESKAVIVDATLLKPGESADCWCGLPAVRRCQGCGEAYCDGHWNRHSHKTKEGP